MVWRQSNPHSNYIHYPVKRTGCSSCLWHNTKARPLQINFLPPASVSCKQQKIHYFCILPLLSFLLYSLLKMALITVSVCVFKYIMSSCNILTGKPKIATKKTLIWFLYSCIFYTWLCLHNYIKKLL